MAAEFGELPFAPQRAFAVFGVPSEETRGEHAHRTCHQLLVAVKGQLRVLVDDRVSRATVELNSADVGLYLPPMTWGGQHGFSGDAVLLVLASHPYDSDDYIRDYKEFAYLCDSARLRDARTADRP